LVSDSSRTRDISTAHGARAPGIEIRGLEFAIGSFSMKGLHLSVKRDEYCVLSGPNGAGKTLLIKLICGLHRPAAGSISIDGEPVHDVPPWERSIGYVPQDGVLFPNRDVRGNIAFGLEVRGVEQAERDRRVTEQAERMGIAHLLDRRPEGLSGGERQKVCIARALVYGPSVLLLDEPVSAIDESARDEICGLLRSLRDDKPITVLHVSHNRHETELVADRVVRMCAGAVESGGTSGAGAATGDDDRMDHAQADGEEKCQQASRVPGGAL
jgi:ABC-type sugar transport system ATPase subunit